jgi:hypothetical protein
VIVSTPGKYILREAIRTRNANSIATLPAGCEIYVQVVDRVHQKIFGKPLLDWHGWDLPVEPSR